MRATGARAIGVEIGYKYSMKLHPMTGIPARPVRMSWLVWACAIPLQVFAVAFTVPPAATQDSKNVFELVLTGSKLAQGLDRIPVKQGDSVELVWRSDQPAEIHLHGYDKLVNVRPGAPARMAIECHATGRFAITLHGSGPGGHSHKPLAYFEVHPQ
ncbi:MAG: hypothetical protein VX871_04760 [Pseudomonadota bacterium]|nr:hypothetical protein [Pseudomonadota bacterium]